MKIAKNRFLKKLSFVKDKFAKGTWEKKKKERKKENVNC